MELLETDVMDRLNETDEVRRLTDQHREFEQQLEQIANRRPFTQQDWFEEHMLKKQKLQVKDRLATLSRDAPALVTET